MKNCIFCQIASKKIPANIQYEDNDVVAFDDINPKAEIHILIVPKKHIESVATMEKKDIELIGKMVWAAKKVAEEKHLEGYKLIFNVGRAGGQIVDHVHLHLLGGHNFKSVV